MLIQDQGCFASHEHPAEGCLHTRARARANTQTCKIVSVCTTCSHRRSLSLRSRRCVCACGLINIYIYLYTLDRPYVIKSQAPRPRPLLGQKMHTKGSTVSLFHLVNKYIKRKRMSCSSKFVEHVIQTITNMNFKK